VFVEWINRAGDYHQHKPKEHTATAPNFLEFQKRLHEIPWESKKVRLSNQTYKNHISHTESEFTNNSKTTGNYELNVMRVEARLYKLNSLGPLLA